MKSLSVVAAMVLPEPTVMMVIRVTMDRMVIAPEDSAHRVATPVLVATVAPVVLVVGASMVTAVAAAQAVQEARPWVAA